MRRSVQPTGRFFRRPSAWLLLAVWLPCLPHPMTSAAEPTPINRPWTGPYGGVPPFDQVRVADLGPALEAAMEAELDAVAESEARRWFHQRALEEAETQAAAWYRGHWAGIRDMARAFPEGHVRRFEAQYPQYNLTRIFGLSPRSGLSNFLSCYPKDPMYLKPLTFDEEGQPVRSVDGTIAGGLLRILESHPPVAPVSAMPVRIS